MLGALPFCHLLMPVYLTLLDFQCLCLRQGKSLSLDRRRNKEREKTERMKGKEFLVMGYGLEMIENYAVRIS
jgi:hypothetical protein